jgi:hypothetical protein
MRWVRRSGGRGLLIVAVALWSLLPPGVAPFGADGMLGAGAPRSAWAFEVTTPDVLRSGGLLNTPSIIAILIGAVGNFDPAPRLSPDGRGVLVSGHVTCSFVGETGLLQVVLTQSATGATALGFGQVTCAVGRGGRQPWTALAVAQGPTPLRPGAGQACAAVVSTRVDRWCAQRGVTLTATGGLLGPAGGLPGVPFGPPPLLLGPPF